MPTKLPHYLRSERRRLALTQADIAALLGSSWKGRISRYEGGALPPTEVALAYELILGKPAAELFRGIQERAGAAVRRRARELLQNDRGSGSSKRLRRRQTLERIAA